MRRAWLQMRQAFRNPFALSSSKGDGRSSFDKLTTNGTAALGAALALALAACKPVGPDYVRPTLPAPAEYKGLAGAWKPAQPGDSLPRGKWWEIFGDSTLNALADRVDPANWSIREAEARYAQAQAALRQARAGLYPTITASGSARRSRLYSDSRGAGSDYELGVDAAWEPDFWGRVRRGVEAGEAQAQAAAADLESVRLAAIASLVQNYLLLRTVDEQARLLAETVATFERSLKLTMNRYKVGVAGKSDVVQAETQLRSAQAQLLDVGVQRAQLENAIAVLVGVSPAELSIAAVDATPKLPPIPTGLPSELLQRRPDVAAAERRVAAASARIGVAESAMFPSVNLTASGAISSTTFPELLRAPTLFWALGAAAVQILFDAGERRAVTDQARAALDAEAAFYRQTVLTGFQEVEDNLAILRILEEEAKLQADAVASARESVKLTENRYKAGTAGILEVIVVQQIQLNNERTEVGILGRRLVAAVQLVKALGGGWDARALDGVLSRSSAGSTP
jgi:NodT family efflux transporter outer membrane factor (OMF) lipoprotein